MWVKPQSLVIIFMVLFRLPSVRIVDMEICGLGHKVWCQPGRIGSCLPPWGMWICGLSHKVSDQYEWLGLCLPRWRMWICGLTYKGWCQFEWFGSCLPQIFNNKLRYMDSSRTMVIFLKSSSTSNGCFSNLTESSVPKGWFSPFIICRETRFMLSRQLDFNLWSFSSTIELFGGFLYSFLGPTHAHLCVYLVFLWTNLQCHSQNWKN